MEQNSPRELMQLSNRPTQVGGFVCIDRVRVSLPRLHMNDMISTEYRRTHHHGGSQIEDNLAPGNYIYILSTLTMHIYLFYISNGATLFETLQPLPDGLVILPSSQAQLPNFHYSSPLSSLLLPENFDTYVAGPSRYNCVLGQDRIWWGSG